MKKLLVASLILCITPFCLASMNLSFSTGAGWSGSPTIVTMADTNTTVTINEGIVDPRTCLSQTFKVLATETKLKLDKIAIWQSGGAAMQDPYTLRFVDLGTTDPSYQGGGSQTYAKGTDLWGGDITFTFDGTASRGAGMFDLTGADELMLTAGNYYAFEITAASPIGGMWWCRSTTAIGSTYASGAAFVDTVSDTPGIRNQLFLNANGRDFAMAVYLVPEPATIALFVLGGLAVLGKKK